MILMLGPPWVMAVTVIGPGTIAVLDLSVEAFI